MMIKIELLSPIMFNSCDIMFNFLKRQDMRREEVLNSSHSEDNLLHYI